MPVRRSLLCPARPGLGPWQCGRRGREPRPSRHGREDSRRTRGFLPSRPDGGGGRRAPEDRASEPSGHPAAPGHRRHPRQRAGRGLHDLSDRHQHGFHLPSGTDGAHRCRDGAGDASVRDGLDLHAQPGCRPRRPLGPYGRDFRRGPAPGRRNGEVLHLGPPGTGPRFQGQPRPRLRQAPGGRRRALRRPQCRPDGPFGARTARDLSAALRQGDPRGGCGDRDDGAQ